MSHYLLTKSGDYDRRAIHERAKSLRTFALEHGDPSDIYRWLRYAWRSARSQRQRAQWSQVEKAARAAIAETEAQEARTRHGFGAIA